MALWPFLALALFLLSLRAVLESRGQRRLTRASGVDLSDWGSLVRAAASTPRPDGGASAAKAPSPVVERPPAAPAARLTTSPKMPPGAVPLSCDDAEDEAPSALGAKPVSQLDAAGWSERPDRFGGRIDRCKDHMRAGRS